MKTFVLILFVIGSGGGEDSISPSIVEAKFSSMAECWSVGFAMKERDPGRVVWFSCEVDPWM